MAIDAVRSFLARAGQDPVIQAEVDTALASATNKFAALAGVAAAHGYHVTADQLEAAIGSPSDGAELSDHNLEKVAGGAGRPLHRSSSAAFTLTVGSSSASSFTAGSASVITVTNR